MEIASGSHGPEGLRFMAHGAGPALLAFHLLQKGLQELLGSSFVVAVTYIVVCFPERFKEHSTEVQTRQVHFKPTPRLLPNPKVLLRVLALAAGRSPPSSTVLQ